MTDSNDNSARGVVRIRLRDRVAEAARRRQSENQLQSFELTLVDECGYDPYSKSRPTERERLPDELRRDPWRVGPRRG
ncbi:MAG: hypothetical protein NZM12_06385 [Steroidobacteraceae bacterium]|nr:hypothetical protein [Steroidobacteraceae bacterium]MDW8258008.1 hypothetical protein [Gammaproteobacteria bacterium]